MTKAKWWVPASNEEGQLEMSGRIDGYLYIPNRGVVAIVVGIGGKIQIMDIDKIYGDIGEFAKKGGV